MGGFYGVGKLVNERYYFEGTYVTACFILHTNVSLSRRGGKSLKQELWVAMSILD